MSGWTVWLSSTLTRRPIGSGIVCAFFRDEPIACSMKAIADSRYAIDLRPSHVTNRHARVQLLEPTHERALLVAGDARERRRDLHQRALEVLRVGAVAVANLGQQVGQALEQEARRRVVLHPLRRRRVGGAHVAEHELEAVRRLGVGLFAGHRRCQLRYLRRPIDNNS